MNRRTSIKAGVAFLSLGLTSFSIYKWLNLNSKVDLGILKEKEGVIAELAELIIPRTDTPGAKDAGVESYIIDMIQSCTDTKGQHNFIYGLIDLEDYTRKDYGKEFLECDKDEKQEILKHFESKSMYTNRIINKISNRVFGQSFFSKLKQLTVAGYCTSEVGATRGLAYDYIPGSFQACIPLKKNQKSWATK